MERIIRHHASTNPDSVALVEDNASFTYSCIFQAAEKLAKELGCSGPIVHDEPIAIILPPGSKQVVAQLAVRIAGGICVPFDISQPPQRTKRMLRDINVQRILIGKEVAGSYPEYRCVEVRDIQADNLAIGQQAPAWQGPSSRLQDYVKAGRLSHQRSHILFTSGSSGPPKPVQVTDNAILHLAFGTPVTPFGSGDRVTEFSSPGFDLSLFEIWVPLLSGATIVVIPNTIVTDPTSLASFLESQRVTILFIPTALFNIIVSVSPGCFRSLRHVLVGGEDANAQAMRSVLNTEPPQHLWNVYGPTECTTMSTMLEVKGEDVDESKVSIGFPIGETEIYLLDEELKPILQPGQRGEICIGGPGKSPGYWNRPEETARSFIKLRLTKDAECGEIDVYRTGDSAEWRRDMPGCLDFIGRQDFRVKHKTFRIELEEIAHILEEDDRVKTAVVIKPRSRSILVAFVVLHTWASASTPEDILSGAKERLPYYMIPDSIVLKADFALTVRGKVDRNALWNSVAHTYETADSDDLFSGRVQTYYSQEDKSSKVKRMWKKLLGAATLIALVRKVLGLSLTMDALHANSCFADLARFLEAETVAQTDAPDDTAIWKGDVRLADDIKLVHDWPSNEEGNVFLTGATGFVGVHLLCRFLAQPEVRQVACLVRRKGTQSAESRLRWVMERYDLYPDAPEMLQKIVVLEGDQGKDDLGLGQSRFEWLTRWASAVFHLAAKVNFCESYKEHYRDNVLGTRNVLQVAAQGRRKVFHYMSSIDVWGPTGCILGTREVLDDGPLEPHLPSLRYETGYGQSKWTAEAMVRRVQERGLPVVIYRPGFIIGDCVHGASNPNDFVSRLIAGCIQLGSFPDIMDMRFEYVTVDSVVSAITHIASSSGNIGRCYHILPTDQSLSITMHETCDVINQAGYPVELTEYSLWVEKLARMQGTEGPLAPLMPLLQEKVLGGRTRWEVAEYTPRYDAANTLRALSDRPDIAFVPFTASLLQKMIAFWERKGFYKL